MSSKLYEWIPIKKGEDLPDNAVYTGQTESDGKVYVAKFDNSPGKVNITNGKINNFWSQAYLKSRQEGEILISNGINNWVELKKEEKFPQNAVYVGRDYNRDKVWVGKDVTTDEPGKVTCINNDDVEPKMAHLWCHSFYRTDRVKIADILVIDELPKPIIEKKIENIETGISDEWGENTYYSSIEENIKSSTIEISVDNIVKQITTAVGISLGDLTHLTQLISSLKLDIKMNIQNIQKDSKLETESMINDINKECYIRLKYYKKNIEQTRGFAGIFSSQKFDYKLIIKYTIIQPRNEVSINRCEKLKNKLIKKILDNFDNES